MKDWKMATVTWSKRDYGTNFQKQQPQYKPSAADKILK